MDFKQTLWADSAGPSLHADVRCGANDRRAGAQLSRYITRPALANERVQTSAVGQVVLKLKAPLARRHHEPGNATAGVPATVGRAGATCVTASANEPITACQSGVL